MKNVRADILKSQLVDNIVNEPIEVEVVEEPPEVETEMEETEPEETLKALGESIAVVKGCRFLNIRDQPSSNGKILTVVQEDTELMMFDSADMKKEWTTIRPPTGYKGYCMTKFLAIK